MKLFIINEDGMQEFIPLNFEQTNEDNNYTSFFEKLKSEITSQQERTKPEINLYTFDKVVEIFDTTRPTIYSWIDYKLLKPIKIGGRVYFKQSDIEELIRIKSEE